MAQFFSAENSKVLKKISYDNHPRGIVDDPVLVEKSLKEPKMTQKNALELHILTQHISGKIQNAKLKQVMATIREE